MFQKNDRDTERHRIAAKILGYNEKEVNPENLAAPNLEADDNIIPDRESTTTSSDLEKRLEIPLRATIFSTMFGLPYLCFGLLSKANIGIETKAYIYVSISVLTTIFRNPIMAAATFR